MDNDYWHKAWKDNNIKFNQQQANHLLKEYFPQLGLSNQASVFVPLCGKSIDMAWLLQQDFKVVGVELSDIAVQSFFQENNIPYQIKQIPNFILYQAENINIYCGDFFNLTQDHLKTVTGVYDRAAFIALPPETRKQYAEHFKQILNPGSQILLITIEYHTDKDLSPPFSIHNSEVTEMFDEQFNVQLLKEIERDKVPAKLAENGVSQVKTDVYRLQHR